MKKHIFTLPIGDWSDDGHGKCEYYTVESNKSIEEVREIHFQIKNKLGIDIENIASKYEDSTIDVEIVEQLFELGFDKFIDSVYDYCLSEYNGHWTVYEKGMAYLWAFLLMKTDKELELRIIPTPPMLSFYGFDENKRHIGFVGYGCFY